MKASFIKNFPHDISSYNNENAHLSFSMYEDNRATQVCNTILTLLQSYCHNHISIFMSISVQLLSLLEKKAAIFIQHAMNSPF